MSLRSKTLIVLSFVVILYVILDYAIQQLVIFPSYISLENAEAKKDIERCVEALQREIYHLKKLNDDWSAWDDTYRFVEDRNNEYIVSNLGISTLKNNKLNLIYFCNTAGKVVWGESYDLETEEKIQLSEFPSTALSKTDPFLQHKDVDSSVAGVFMTEKGPMLVASEPIITSEWKGPIRGSLIMARFLDHDLIKTLVEQTRVQFLVTALNKNSLSANDLDALNHMSADNPVYIMAENKDHLKVSTTFVDVKGLPALLITADIPRDISRAGIVTSRYGLVSVMIAGRGKTWHVFRRSLDETSAWLW